MLNMFNTFEFGSVTFNGRKYHYDVYIFPNEVVEPREKYTADFLFSSEHKITDKELILLMRFEPEVILIGTGYSSKAKLTKDAENYLKRSKIKTYIGSTPKIIKKFNALKELRRRMAVLVHVTT